MKVKDIMVGRPVTCSPDTNLGAAVELLWDRNCGFLPIVGSDGKLNGVVTDRDICIALGTQNRLPAEICVGEVTTGEIYSCAPEDDIHTALATMRKERVRRLPVVDGRGVLQGVLSMDDVVFHVGAGKGRGELSHEEVVNTFKAIYTPLVPLSIPAKSAAA
jgi:CBS domain-containing protein